MAEKIIIFSGMPASGKDTVSEELCRQDERFIALKKYRSVSGQDQIKDTYFNVSKEEFDKMAADDCFIQYHCRYGRGYGIAKTTLYDNMKDGKIPIIHIGRIENYYTFCRNIPSFLEEYKMKSEIIHIQLWETLEVLSERIRSRDKTKEEIEKRKQALWQEFSDNVDMMRRGEKPYTLVIKNNDIQSTVQKITAYLQGAVIEDGYDVFWNYLITLEDKK